MTSGGCEVDVRGRGAVHDYMYIPESNFLTDQAEYLRSCVNVWGIAYIVTEHSMMKSSMLFECRPLPLPPSTTSCPPDVIHVCSQAFPFFFFCSSAFVYYTECKPKNNNGEGPETRVGVNILCMIMKLIKGAVWCPRGIVVGKGIPEETFWYLHYIWVARSPLSPAFYHFDIEGKGLGDLVTCGAVVMQVDRHMGGGDP